MPQDNYIVGLDIGTTKVCAVIGELKNGNVLEIIGVGMAESQGLRRGVVINIESTLKSVNKAVEAAEMMSGHEVKDVVAGIAGAHIEGINSRGVVAVTGKNREITREDVDRVVEAAKAIVIPMDREVLHVIPQEFTVDDQNGIKDPLDMIGVRLEAEVHIITGSVTSIQNLVRCINRAGFKVEDVILQSLASAEAVLTREEKELGCLMIDMGGGTADILVHLDGSPYYTGVVSVGGQQVTRDISIMLKTPVETAESIKCESACCYAPLAGDVPDVILPGVGGRPPVSVPVREVCRIVQPRMAEIYALVKEQIDKKGLGRMLGGGIVLTGGGSKLKGSVELAQEVFGLPARIGYPVKLGGLSGEYQGPEYATAVGLAMYAAQRGVHEAEAAPHPDKDPQGGVWGKMRKWFREFL